MATDRQPIACTLSSKDLQERRAWIADLAGDSLLNHQRRDLALCLWCKSDAAARVREMVRQEEACCAFLKFEMHEQPNVVRLTIKAPEAAREVIDALFDQFITSAR